MRREDEAQVWREEKGRKGERGGERGTGKRGSRDKGYTEKIKNSNGGRVAIWNVKGYLYG